LIVQEAGQLFDPLTKLFAKLSFQNIKVHLMCNDEKSCDDIFVYSHSVAFLDLRLELADKLGNIFAEHPHDQTDHS
jgi:hypothetical protein